MGKSLRLCFISDRHGLGNRALLPILFEAIGAEIDLIQIREKDLGTRSLLELTQSVTAYPRKTSTQIVVNDRLDIAYAASADGVHLGGQSLPVARVRNIVPKEFLVGASCHSVHDVLQAESTGASYALLGPIFETPSKRDYGPPLGLSAIEEAVARAQIPVYVLGGITVERAMACMKAGARGIAGIRLFQDVPSLEQRIQELRELAV